MGIPESVYKGDPRSNTDVARFNNSRETVALFDNAFAKKTRDEWIKAFEGKDIFWEKVQKIENLSNDPQVIANEYLTDYTHPLTGETYKYQNLPMQFRGTPAMRQGRAPLLGEHTEEILVDILGYKKEDMPKLLDEIGHP
jgi:CoA:oxalate CoA-transferase